MEKSLRLHCKVWRLSIILFFFFWDCSWRGPRCIDLNCTNLHRGNDCDSKKAGLDGLKLT